MKKRLFLTQSLIPHRSIHTLESTQTVKSIKELNAITSVNKTVQSSNKLKAVVKDNFHVAGMFTTCASHLLKHWKVYWDATAVQHLKKSFDIIGKCNMDEFAMGSSSTSSCFGSVLNPLDLTRSAGGSSGGCAAAIAAGYADIALASDTGGSIRQPASHCGVIGFKPSYGRISRHGLVQYAASLDTVGIMSTSIDLVQQAFRLCIGDSNCTRDSTHWMRQADTPSNFSIKTVGVPWSWIQTDQKGRLYRQLELLAAQGLEIKTIDPRQLPDASEMLAIYYTHALSEAVSALSRFNFHTRHPWLDTSTATFSNSVTDPYQLIGEEVQLRLAFGRHLMQKTVHFQWALNARLRLRDRIAALFDQSIDLIALPTTTSVAPKLSSICNETSRTDLWDHSQWDNLLSERNYSAIESNPLLYGDRFTPFANLCALPAISLPVACDKNQLPIGLQLVAPFGRDEELLQLSDRILNTTY